MSGTVGIEQLGQLMRGALLIGDRVIPGVGRISEMCGVEKMVVTVDLGFVVDRHNVSFLAPDQSRFHAEPRSR